MERRITHILVATDFNPASDAALACARDIAQQFAARLSLLHVVTDPRAVGVWTPEVYVPAQAETRARLLHEARERLERALPADERSRFAVTIDARVGDVAENILEAAREQKVDLIVMGTHGRHGLAHLVLGSVAERVLRDATCPVLTTHAELQGSMPIAGLSRAGWSGSFAL
jgi:nucleotide-binding universal stress UspA family protein